MENIESKERKEIKSSELVKIWLTHEIPNEYSEFIIVNPKFELYTFSLKNLDVIGELVVEENENLIGSLVIWDSSTASNFRIKGNINGEISVYGKAGNFRFMKTSSLKKLTIHGEVGYLRFEDESKIEKLSVWRDSKILDIGFYDKTKIDQIDLRGNGKYLRIHGGTIYELNSDLSNVNISIQGKNTHINHLRLESDIKNIKISDKCRIDNLELRLIRKTEIEIHDSTIGNNLIISYNYDLKILISNANIENLIAKSENHIHKLEVTNNSKINNFLIEESSYFGDLLIGFCEFNFLELKGIILYLSIRNVVFLDRMNLTRCYIKKLNLEQKKLVRTSIFILSSTIEHIVFDNTILEDSDKIIITDLKSNYFELRNTFIEGTVVINGLKTSKSYLFNCLVEFSDGVMQRLIKPFLILETKSERPSCFLIENSNLGKTEIIDADLERFKSFYFKNSNIISCFFSQVNIPKIENYNIDKHKIHLNHKATEIYSYVKGLLEVKKNLQRLLESSNKELKKLEGNDYLLRFYHREKSKAESIKSNLDRITLMFDEFSMRHISQEIEANFAKGAITPEYFNKILEKFDVNSLNKKIKEINELSSNEYSKIEDIDKLSQAGFLYSQLKVLYSGQGNRTLANEIHATELNLYRLLLVSQKSSKKLTGKGLWNNRKDRITLFINRYSSNYGTNWLRAVLVTMGLTISCFGMYLYLLGYRLTILGPVDWEKTFELVSHSLSYLNPLRDEDTSELYKAIEKDVMSGYLQRGKELGKPCHIITPWARIWDYFSRIVVGFMVYQTIAAFRSLGKSGN